MMKRAKKRAPRFVVTDAMMKPAMPTSMGIEMCRKRSPVLSAWRALKKTTSHANAQIGAVHKRVTMRE
jgi:hypothetical protein